MNKNQQIKVNIGAACFALSEAKALKKAALQIAKELKNANSNNDLHHGDRLTFNIIGGLSIELYLKAIMISARSGVITKGHDLNKLYSEFPPFLIDELERIYKVKRTAIKDSMTDYAFTLTPSPTPPEKPQEEDVYFTFESFKGAIDAFSKLFVRDRYFFETINLHEWSHVYYAPEQMRITLETLEDVYCNYMKGEYRGRLQL